MQNLRQVLSRLQKFGLSFEAKCLQVQVFSNFSGIFRAFSHPQWNKSHPGEG